MTAAAAIDRLRAIAARLDKHKDPDAQWFMTSLLEYESGVALGRTLENALGIVPSWWRIEAIERRDELLRELASILPRQPSERATAEIILKKLDHYRASAWQNDRALMAPGRPDPVRVRMHRLLKLDVPAGFSTIRRALAHETPLSVSHEACDPHSNVEKETACESHR